MLIMLHLVVFTFYLYCTVSTLICQQYISLCIIFQIIRTYSMLIVEGLFKLKPANKVLVFYFSKLIHAFLMALVGHIKITFISLKLAKATVGNQLN